MKSLKIAALTVALLASGSVLAEVQKSIHVAVEVAAALDMVKGDGTALPSIPYLMGYTPNVGLKDLRIPIRILTNDLTKGVRMRMEPLATLTTAVPGATPVSLSVDLGTNHLDNIFDDIQGLEIAAAPAGSGWAGQSEVVDIVVRPTVVAPIPAGHYTGEVRFIMKQST